MLLRTAAIFALVASAALAAEPAKLAPTDWPQFRGQNRNGVSLETGLLKKWPEGGPKLLWKIEGIGSGCSAPVIIGNKLYVLGGIKQKATVLTVDIDKQQIIQSIPVGSGNGRGEQASLNVVGNRAYFMTVDSQVGAVDLDNAKLLWSTYCRKDLKGDMQHVYGYSETPLIDGDKCIFSPGAKDAAIMAVHRDTGEVIWKTPMPKLSGKGPALASYSSLVISEAAGVRQYVTLLGPGLIGVDAKTGKFLWGHDKNAQQHSNIPTPLVVGDFVWSSNGYNGGTTCLKIVADKNSETGLKVEEQYYLKPEVCQNQCGQSVVLGDFVYTGHGQYAGEPMCLDWKTGKILWKAKQPGRGVAGLIAADGMLYFRAENGEVSLIEANPKEYKLVSTFKLDQKSPGLSHPVISNGRLYLRDGDKLSCYDIRDPDAQKK
jgi:outer membrane protein assembly factor BamB